MIIFICGLAVVMVAAAAVTTYAVLTAKDGYEDETGFHAVIPGSTMASQESSAKKPMGRTIPPFATAG